MRSGAASGGKGGRVDRRERESKGTEYQTEEGGRRKA